MGEVGGIAFVENNSGAYFLINDPRNKCAWPVEEGDWILRDIQDNLRLVRRHVFETDFRVIGPKLVSAELPEVDPFIRIIERSAWSD